jgi:malate dehydrogenase (oxaloacetate-decarboxylating)
VLAFPGLFRGALDCRARDLTTNMFLAAARAIAALVPTAALSATQIVPSVFDPAVAKAVAAAVKAAAIADGVTKL